MQHNFKCFLMVMWSRATKDAAWLRWWQLTSPPLHGPIISSTFSCNGWIKSNIYATNSRWGEAIWLVKWLHTESWSEYSAWLTRHPYSTRVPMLMMSYPATHFLCYPIYIFTNIWCSWYQQWKFLILGKSVEVVWLSWHQLVKAGTMISPTPTHLPHHQWKHLIWGIGSKLRCSLRGVIQFINLCNFNSQTFRKDVKISLAIPQTLSHVPEWKKIRY